MSTHILVGENVSYAIAQRQLLKNITVSFGAKKTGLVGDNGVGKTTLIRILVEQIQPDSGVVHAYGPIGYLPQDFVIYDGQTIADVLGIEQKLLSLARIESGTSDSADVDIIADDWDIAERVQALFSQLGLEYLKPSRTIKTLSGGETARVFFAHLLLKRPAFLILDEPTNNLDRRTREALYEAIKNFSGGVLVVSHDRQLLAHMDQIIELSSHGLKTYGGNYAAYAAQKKIEREAQERHVHDAQKQLKKTKKIVQQTKERYERRVKMGKKAKREGGQPAMYFNVLRERSEKTKSKLEKMTDKLLESAHDKLDQAKIRCEQKDLLNFELDASGVHSTKKVLEVEQLAFAYQGCEPVITDFNLILIGNERIALAGPNGSGKTTLLKLLTKQLEPTKGRVYLGVERYVYLDQWLSILDFNQTILENFKRLNPDEKETDCRTRLATFLFSSSTVLKTVASLSGGEKTRAALACILMGQTPAQLIVLDEPTNNMDLDSIASIEQALLHYRGALVVVSHDDTFLKNIGIDEIVDMVKSSSIVG